VDQVVPCPACGKWVQSVAVECRHCGKPMPSRFPINPDPKPTELGPVSSPASRAAAARPPPPPEPPPPPRRQGTGETRDHIGAWIVFVATFVICLILLVVIEGGTRPHPLAIACLAFFGFFNTIALFWLLIRSAVKDAIISAHLQERGE
jgi:hypothetical protein